jgi:hypothetical protein
METKKILTGAEANWTLQMCIESMRDRVYQYKRAGRSLYNTGIYTRGESILRGGKLDVWILTEDGIDMLFSSITPHRAYVALNAYKNGKLENVDVETWNNYITNGYTTRFKGLFGDYQDKTRDRMKVIAHSHAEYLGCETGSSSLDHSRRVAMRDRW